MTALFYHIGPLVIRSTFDLQAARVLPQAHNATVSLADAIIPALHAPKSGEDCVWTERGVWLFHNEIAVGYVSPSADATLLRADSKRNMYLRLLQALRILAVQRGAVLLHASAIIKDGVASIWVGDSGSGKSTRAATEAMRGAAHSNDDIVPVILDDRGRACTFQIDRYAQLFRQTPLSGTDLYVRLPEASDERGDGKLMYCLNEADPSMYPIHRIEWLMSPGEGVVLDGSTNSGMRILLHHIVGRGMIQKANGRNHLAVIAALVGQLGRASSEKETPLVDSVKNMHTSIV